MFLQLLALEDMGVKAEDLLMYSQVEVSGLLLFPCILVCPWPPCKEALMTHCDQWEVRCCRMTFRLHIKSLSFQ